MFNRICLITEIAVFINCLSLCQKNYVNWPVVFIGLGVALANLLYNVYQDWQKSLLMQMLEEDGYMDQIERESEEIARKILDKLEDEDSDD
jgi:hypothetical protein